MRNPFATLWSSILRLLRREPSQPKSLAENLILNHHDDTVALLDAIIRNGHYTRVLYSVSPVIMTALIKDRDVSWVDKVSIMNSGKMPVEAFEFLVAEKSLSHELAICEYTPPAILAKLGLSSDWAVKDYVARNHNCPKDTAIALSTDESFLVRESLASHTVFIDLLRVLASDGSIAVRAGVAKNKHTPQETRHHLSKDVSKVVAGLVDRSLPVEMVPFVQGLKEAVDA